MCYFIGMTTAKKAKAQAKAPAKASKSVAEEVITKSVGVRELRQNASQVLDLVKRGEVIIVTERGKPIAELQPIKKSKYQLLLESGAITPAKEPFDPEFWSTTDLPRYPNAVEEFLKERHEARF